ncbi:MAG: ABC transporter substrate-binding protein [Planctomycetes bacterium]|nr:ABC transporter substrate-binding protein [Planctomycetota bacterium]
MTEHSDTGSVFSSRKFTDFATVSEALAAKEIGASFILAPLAMNLVDKGLPVKVVYLGHRDGTAIVVRKNGDIHDFRDLAGKTVAIPMRYSNQNILLHKMMKERGMPYDSMNIIELPPPEHPTALAEGSIDAYIVGEPFCAKAELDGSGRILAFTKDIWPEFISCVLVVRQDLIDERRDLVQELVDGIARSGKWLDEDPAHRLDAAEVAGKNYYFQSPELLAYVLSRPLDRVKYTHLAPLKDDFDEIMELAVEIGVLPRRVEFGQYADTSFVRTDGQEPWALDRLPTGPAAEAVR